MLLKNENASIRLDFVSYEFPETEYGMDEYDKNWLQLRCTWVDEDGYTHKDSNACLLAQELAGMNAGLKVLAAGIKDRLTMEEVARRYGYEPGRSGFLRCPFHSGDRTAPFICPTRWMETIRRS